MRLGVLDQAPIRDGGSAAEAVRESIALSQAVEGFGYARFWLAEHHSAGSLACAAPEVLIAAAAAATSRIRVGSGGIMLTHYSSLKVAEQFRMLETLHPGRIDLGIGRAPGGGHLANQALALGPGMLTLEHYPRQVEDLVGYLANALPEDHPFHSVRAMPVGEGAPEIWLLGSSTESALIAAQLGLPFSYAQFINPEAGERATSMYRERYRPSRWYPDPRVSVGVSALAAPSEAEAIRLSWSRYCARFRRGGIPSPEVAIAFEYSGPEREYIEYSRARAAIGSPDQVRERLETLARDLTADELILLTITYDFEDRVRSYRLIADAFGLEGEAAP